MRIELVKPVIHPFVRWLARTFEVHGFEGSVITAKYRVFKYREGHSVPYEVTPFTPSNKVCNTGLSHIIKLITGEASTTLNNGNARLGSGDSSTAAAAAQTNLQAATNKTWVAMDASYPTSEASQATTLQSTFGAGVASWSWAEVGFARGDPGSGGIFGGRRVYSFGTKGAGDSWALNLVLTASSAT